MAWSEYRINDPLRIRRWLDKTLMADLGNDTRLEKLTQVERNVPPIVLFLRDSYRSSGQKQTEISELLTLVHQKLFLESIPMFVLNIIWSRTNSRMVLNPIRVSVGFKGKMRESHKRILSNSANRFMSKTASLVLFSRMSVWKSKHANGSRVKEVGFPCHFGTPPQSRAQFKVVIALSPWSIDNNRFKQLVPNFDLTKLGVNMKPRCQTGVATTRDV